MCLIPCQSFSEKYGGTSLIKNNSCERVGEIPTVTYKVKGELRLMAGRGVRLQDACSPPPPKKIIAGIVPCGDASESRNQLQCSRTKRKKDSAGTHRDGFMLYSLCKIRAPRHPWHPPAPKVVPEHAELIVVKSACLDIRLSDAD